MKTEHTERLIEALEKISHGNNQEPTGFEALAMALCGTGTPGTQDSVAAGLHDIADALRSVAVAITEKEL